LKLPIASKPRVPIPFGKGGARSGSDARVHFGVNCRGGKGKGRSAIYNLVVYTLEKLNKLFLSFVYRLNCIKRFDNLVLYFSSNRLSSRNQKKDSMVSDKL